MGSRSPSATTVAIGVSSSRKSKATERAVRWVLHNDHSIHHIDHMILIHVMPPITSIPTPSGELVSTMEMDADVVSMYRKDMISKCDGIFLPFKRLSKTREFETLVLEDDSPAYALLRYIEESGVKILVLGQSSSNCITRKLKGISVSSTILEISPNTCDIYLVARDKVITKLPYCPPVSGTSAGQRMLTQAENHEDLDTSDSRRSSISKLVKESSEALERMPLRAHKRGSSSTSLLLEDKHKPNHKKSPTKTQADKTPDYMTLSEDKQIALQEELERMQLDLKITLDLYDQTCGDLVHVQKKVQSLSSECQEEAKKVSAILYKEEMLRKIAAEERALYLEAMKGVEVSKQELAKEAQERQKAERTAFMESWKKQQIIDALFTSDKRYRKYTKDEIELATEFFSDAKTIGEGGYGRVYRCTLDHTPVAIKVFHADTSDKKQEFLREVEVLSQLRHPYLVSLLAACPEIGCLVYEYMENGSLEECLFCTNYTPPLPWFIRFRVAFEVASALAFLHSTQPEPVVHCDLKPGNILLDGNYVSKIGDVGLAKLMSDIVPDGVTEYRGSVISGTLYYMDPEYQRTGTIRPKSDVYAFGVVVLQLLTGCRPKGLILAVENAINNGRFADILDKSSSDWPLAESEELARIALKCSKLKCRDRPDLENEVLPILQKLQSIAHAGFQLQKNSICAPNHYFCPILQEIMNDPYIAADGFTYEHGAIKAWLQKYSVSPVSGGKLAHTTLIPNKTLRSSIQEWRRCIAC